MTVAPLFFCPHYILYVTITIQLLLFWLDVTIFYFIVAVRISSAVIGMVQFVASIITKTKYKDNSPVRWILRIHIHIQIHIFISKSWRYTEESSRSSRNSAQAASIYLHRLYTYVKNSFLFFYELLYLPLKLLPTSCS